MRFRHLVLGLALAWSAGACAQAWPTKPVRFIVPYGPGTSDSVARLVAQRLGDRLGQNVLVETRAGGDGLIGAEVASKAPPDGYTIFFSTTGTMAIAPNRRKKLNYDPHKDFVHVGQTSTISFALAINPATPATSVSQLVALAKAKPGQLTYASSSETGFITAETLKLATGMDVLHVPYKGSGQITNDLLSGQVTMMFATFANVIPQQRNGKLRVLAVTGERRSPALPDVPTMKESGVKDYESSSQWGVSVPAGTPQEIVRKLNAEMVAALKAPDVGEKMIGLGVDLRTGTPEEYHAVLQSEFRKYRELLPKIGLQQE